MKKIILASQSPRRRELLTLAGYDFEVIVSDVDEKITKELPSEIAEDLSRQKAEAVLNIASKKYGDDIIDYVIIGADTVVSVDGEILGKPKDREAAHRMISMLQGRTHQVYTGVSIIRQGQTGIETHTFSECTEVTFYSMTDEEVWSYINTGDCEDKSDNQSEVQFSWQDKAGGYGIQESFGARFIKSIKGDYNNVVGLPISKLYQEMKEIVR